jgi:hypothetical protein
VIKLRRTRYAEHEERRDEECIRNFSQKNLKQCRPTFLYIGAHLTHGCGGAGADCNSNNNNNNNNNNKVITDLFYDSIS